MKKKQEKLDQEINIAAIDMATDSILKADRKKQIEELEFSINKEEKIKERANELLDSYQHQLDPRVYKLAKDELKNGEKEAKKKVTPELEEADSYSLKYNQLTDALDEVRNKKQALLDGADLPLPGLSVAESKLIYNSVPWDGMSGAEQLKVATAIVRKLNPECGFVLMDKLEQMDLDTLQEFGEWLKDQGLQVIATRVSTGAECSIIIEDGMVKGTTDGIAPSKPKFTAGAF